MLVQAYATCQMRCPTALPPHGAAAEVVPTCPALLHPTLPLLRSYSVWMVAADACALTCGRCTPCACTCTDVPPDGQYTCAQQASSERMLHG